MVAIEVKYLGPTNFKGSRYKAEANGNTFTYNANYSLNPEENALQAARHLKTKMGWKGSLIGSSTKRGWVFVFKN